MTAIGFLDTDFNNKLIELGFDFDRFPLINPEYPIILCILYITSVITLSRKINASKPVSSGSLYTFQNIVIFAHNLALCIFSVLCFISSAPIFFRMLRKEGWNGILCENQLFHDDRWWQWVYLFYLSKYYEFVDTYILIWKGRNPSFLQKFHHVGAVMGMWLIVATKSHTGYVFIIPNSFIHSIMYFYYALSVWKIKMPFKYILTRMQIIQFVAGLLQGMVEAYHWECSLFADKLSLCWNYFYVSMLLVLFLVFYRDTYRHKKTKTNWKDSGKDFGSRWEYWKSGMGPRIITRNLLDIQQKNQAMLQSTTQSFFWWLPDWSSNYVQWKFVTSGTLTLRCCVLCLPLALRLCAVVIAVQIHHLNQKYIQN